MALLVGVVRIRGTQMEEAKIGFGRKEKKWRCGVSPGREGKHKKGKWGEDVSAWGK
jgi:hypothetical protein